MLPPAPPPETGGGAACGPCSRDGDGGGGVLDRRLLGHLALKARCALHFFKIKVYMHISSIGTYS